MGEARGQTAQQELFQVVSSWRDGFRAQFEHIACTKADRRRIDGRWACDGTHRNGATKRMCTVAPCARSVLRIMLALSDHIDKHCCGYYRKWTANWHTVVYSGTAVASLTVALHMQHGKPFARSTSLNLASEGESAKVMFVKPFTTLPRTAS